MEITIENLIFKGIHGLTEKEKQSPQRFAIDIVIKPWRTIPAGEKIAETVDYRTAKKLAQTIIENEHYDLMETIAAKIAAGIIADEKVKLATVRVRKLDIWDNGRPGVTVTRQALPPLDLLDFDLSAAIKELLYQGGTSIPILPEKRLAALRQEAESYLYTRQPEIVGPAKVREELSSFDQFPSTSLFCRLRDDFTELINYKLFSAGESPFAAPLNFNELALQKYAPGSIGITPHVDNRSALNLIAVFIIKGQGDLVLCDDRQGTNPRPLEKTPGNVILLRAPGFFGSNKRPFHYLTNITEERITFGLRQNKNET